MGRSKKERCSLFDCPMSKKGEKMSTPVRQRLMRDFKRQLEDQLARISVAPLDKNIVLEKVVIFVPNDYPKGWRHVEAYAAVHEDFPNKPPTVRFVSRMFHPYIYADGSIYFGHFTESMKYNL